VPELELGLEQALEPVLGREPEQVPELGLEWVLGRELEPEPGQELEPGQHKQLLNHSVMPPP